MQSSSLRLVDVFVADSIVKATEPARRVILTSDQRAKSRFRTTLSDGSDAAIMLPRGSVVRPGSRLVAESGELVEVVAASEQVYRVHASTDTPDPAFALLRAAYHLGNRHVPVELGPDLLKLERDPVLRDLLVRLRMIVTLAFEPFVPEPGAYGGGHRHDTDVEGGSTGEALSLSAHTVSVGGIGS